MKSKIFGISLFTITCLYGLLAAIVILIVLVSGGEVLYAVIGSIIVLLIQFLISPWLTDITMRWFYKANFNAEIPEYLRAFIDKECVKHGVTFPKFAVIDDGAPNAFTYGRTKKDARIVVTRGIFELLTEDEVKAVVAHEMGHIVHLDMLVMTAVQIVPLVLYAIYEAFARNNRGDRDNNKAAIIGYIAYLLYIVSQYIILWLSRTREYYADEFSVTETENPNSLAEALVKVGFGLSTKSGEAKRNVSKNNALGIFDTKAGKALAVTSLDESGHISKDRIKNAMKWEMWNPWAKWFEFNSTHPLISKRLQRIATFSEKYNQTPYIVFDLEKKESYVDDFLLEIAIAFLPKIAFIATLIVGAVLFVSDADSFFILGVCLFVTICLSFVKFKRAHRSGFNETTVENLLGEIKVSHITSVPCVLKGEIIGRGNPGCIFNEDFVIKDETGIIFLDYNQPLNIVNKIFALFKSEQYFNKIVKVEGWYRRSPVPYVEIYKYSVDGKEKKIYTYGLSIALYAIGFIISGLLMLSGIL